MVSISQHIREYERRQKQPVPMLQLLSECASIKAIAKRQAVIVGNI